VEAILLVASTRLSWSTRRLLKAFRERGHRAKPVIVSELSVRVDESGVTIEGCGRSHCNPDAVIVRGLGAVDTPEKLLSRLTLLAAFEDMGVVVVNPWLPTLVARNKMLTALYLRRAGVPIPPSMLAESIGPVLRASRDWGRMVVKPLTGSLGLGSFLAENLDQAYLAASLFLATGHPVYAQRFISKEGNADIRVFIVGDRAVAAARRVAAPGEWRTNVARGARTEPVELDEETRYMAVRASKALGLYYAGVDVAIEGGTGRRYVLEVNAMPNWLGLYRATGIDPAEEIVGLVESIVKRGGEE